MQIRRRDDAVGLGIKNSGAESFDWKNEWWNTAYNDSIKKLKIAPKKKLESTSSEDSSSDESSSSDSSLQPAAKTKNIKKGAQKKK